MTDGPQSSPGDEASASASDDALLRAIAAAPPRPISGTPGALDGLDPGTLVDDTFRIDALLGTGAMGVVYLATDVGLDRQVALKLHKSSNDDPRASRMWREAKAMARLSHPNVVTVHEVGVFRDRVYIAMERITGGTLRDWLQTRRPWKDVVAAFVQAGRGLAAAHRVDLVHRDFKPTNALMGDDGRVRVSDFGLARAALDDGTSGRTFPVARTDDSPSLEDRLTQTGAAVGTPAYMSPEQLDGRGVDHRADQYAFCVALHEGLYGVRPFPAESVRELIDAAMRGEVREPPQDRSVPAWVSAVVHRGLRPSPDDRFESMESLLEALGRDPTRRRRVVGGSVLGGIAIGGLLLAVAEASSGPDCADAAALVDDVWTPATSEEVRAAIRASGLSYAEVTAKRVTTGLDAYAQAWARVAVRACERGDVQLSPALRESQVLCLDRRQQALSAAVSLLTRVDATQVGRASEVVDRLPSVAACTDVEYLAIELELPADPEEAQAVAALRTRLDAMKALDDAGSYSEGLRQIDGLVADARSVGYTPVLAEALLRQGLLAEHAGEYEQARGSLFEAYEEAIVCGHEEVAADAAIALIHLLGVRLAQHDAGLEWQLHARAHGRRIRFVDGREGTLENSLGSVQRERGKLDLAFEHYDKTRALWERDLDPDDLRRSRVYHHLGGIERQRNNLEDAERWFLLALDQREEQLGPDHPLVANVLAGLGNVAFVGGQRALAIERYERALRIREAALGENHPEVASLLSNLGIFLQYEGRFEESLAAQERALAIEIATKGEEHPSVATSIENIGSVHLARGEYPKAVEAYKRALGIRERTLGPDHLNVSSVLLNLAMAYEDQGRLDEALELHQRALKLKRANLDASHPQVARSLEAVGTVHFRKKDYASALDAYRKALAIRTEAFGDDHPLVLNSHNNIGNALEELGRMDEALDAHRKGLEIGESLSETDPKRSLSLFNMGQIHRMRGEGAEALPYLERALKLRTEHESPPAELADTRFELAQALRLTGRDPARARAQAEQARDAYEQLGKSRLRDSIDAWLEASAR